MKFKIYTRNDCVWCVRAKAVMEERGHTYEEESADEHDFMFRAFKLKTVPQIFTDDNMLIGGYEELVGFLS